MKECRRSFADSSQPQPKQPPTPRMLQWRTGWKSVIVPALVLVFFLAAPHWLNSRIRSSTVQSLRNSTELSEEEQERRIAAVQKIDFQEVCLGHDFTHERLRGALEQSGVAGNFRRLRYGTVASEILAGVLALAIGSVLWLNHKAQQSPESLIQCYRLGWGISMVATLAKVLLLIPLLAYGTFEFSVLLTDHYLPKLLVIIIIGGLIALVRSVQVLLKKVPLEFSEPMAREVTPQEAPELWEAVRAAAARLHTAPPDHIVAGMQLNFYVTELAVIYGGGRTGGRTLFVSYPLLKQLSEPEVLAIIGHELGHFIGDDTRMTREFYPLKLKVHATLMALAQSGWVAWTSFHFLGFFFWCFEETQQKASRSRELLADQKGAELTSPRTAAQALVKFQVLAEAFSRGLKEAVARHSANPLDLPLQAIIREKLFPETAFWSGLFKQHLPHPLDSHPPLGVRLEALGQSIGEDEARQLALEETESAWSKWFAHREELFAGIVHEGEAVVKQMQSRAQVAGADYKTAEGRELLDRHFPPQTWRASAGRFWCGMGALWLLLLGCAVVAILVNEPVVRVILAMVALLLGLCCLGVWTRHRAAELSVNGEGISYTGWRAPLRFEDVSKLSAQRAYSNVTLIFHLKKPQPAFWKFSVPGLSRKRVALSLSGLNAKPLVIGQTVFRYFTRQLEEK